MNGRNTCAVAFAVVTMILLSVALSVAQTDAKAVVKTAATSKFGGLPVLPSCATFAVEQGDPMKEASILLIKATSGCKVPWHWHTANEQLMFVSGSAKVEMKDAQPHALAKGDFVMLPGKHHHQFTCVSNCLFFNSVEGPFDIHYVDKNGQEITPVEALKTPSKKAPAKK
jgi:quercetin dioxygenase-like cupin family protein